jgi:TerC family integral membrane protein
MLSLPVPAFASAAPVGEVSMTPTFAMWAALGALVIVMLLVDLFVFGRGKREVTVRESAIWTAVWTVTSLGFGALLWSLEGAQAGSEYFAGFLLERSLSLDNIFVFAILFSYFAVPVAVQPRVLAWGIMLALVLRLGFILAGAALLDAFHITFYAFGLLLIYTAWKLARHSDSDVEPEHNPAFRFIRKRVPMSDSYDGPRLFTRLNGRKLATPLLAVFVVVATTDLIFAIDSIPAIFAVTTVPFIVFAANAFAMLGLRALYFLLVGVMDRFVYLSQGLAIILGIIGAKMLLIDVWHVPIWLSLTLIVIVLTATAVLSLRAQPHTPDVLAEPHPVPGDGDADAQARTPAGDCDATRTRH